MIYLVAGITIFLGLHSVRLVAPVFRERMIEKLGAGAWKGIYTAIAVLSLILVVWGYGQARFDNIYLYDPPRWLTHLQVLMMIPALILVVAAECPTGRIKKTVKNPLLIAVKIWAFGHLLVNGDLASLLLFGAFFVWAVLLVINSNRRGNTFPDKTSTKGDVMAVVGGLALWAAIMFGVHEWLIGVPVIA